MIEKKRPVLAAPPRLSRLSSILSLFRQEPWAVGSTHRENFLTQGFRQILPAHQFRFELFRHFNNCPDYRLVEGIIQGV